MMTNTTGTRRQLVDSVRLAAFTGAALLVAASAAFAQHGIGLHSDAETVRMGFRPNMAVVVKAVAPGGPAANAGIHPLDAITHVSGIRTGSAVDVLRYLEATNASGMPAVLGVVCGHTGRTYVTRFYGVGPRPTAPVTRAPAPPSGGYAGGYGMGSAPSYGTGSAPSWLDINSKFISEMNKSMDLQTQCRKNVAGACEKSTAQDAKIRAIGEGNARTAAVIGGMAEQGRINNSVRKTEQAVRDSNASANARSLANDYDQMARDAMRDRRWDDVAKYTAKAAELRRQAGK